MVPLADMLTNTVGIMLFILIFTVLATAGASTLKFFPAEHPTDRRAIFFMCAFNKAYPDDLGKISHSAYFGTANSISIADAKRDIDTDDILLKGNVISGQSGLIFYVDFYAKENRGVPVAQIAGDTSPISLIIQQYKPDQAYPFFFVTADSIEAFLAAREVWSKQGFDYGWKPLGNNDPPSIILIGGGNGVGRTPLPQK